MLCYLGFSYFCLNLVKLDELEKLHNSSVETLQGQSWELQNSISVLIKVLPVQSFFDSKTCKEFIHYSGIVLTIKE